MTSFIDAIRNGQYNKWRKDMKINIWIHKDDIIKGNITEHYYQCPQVGYVNYVQVSITPDEFVQLEDRPKNLTYPEFVNKHYTPTPPCNDENLFKHDNEALIHERNPDTGEIRSRKIQNGINESDKWLVEQYNRNRDPKDWITSTDQIKDN